MTGKEKVAQVFLADKQTACSHGNAAEILHLTMTYVVWKSLQARKLTHFSRSFFQRATATMNCYHNQKRADVL